MGQMYYYVPRLLKHFSAAEINALIAPRPHLALAGDYDRLTPPQRITTLSPSAMKSLAVV